MLLKRLEIQGFKSFSDKIGLDLGHKITAIVGPNGSGKSNITDAIRWLLGERDARNLRGGRVEDLIFAGTDKKPRVGLAQATLYFNNETGFFPLEFSEISISRRISRDGSSGFFINKAEVRLKDLVDLLARAKLGARGLSVINQGENDVFIKASPEERRLMIEEILGLKEFQLKKAEAIRRLQTTALNLEKARALLEELKPHLRFLKKQAARYEAREEIEKNLRQLESQFYGRRLRQLRQELKEVNSREETLKKQLETAKKIVEKAETEFEKISASEPQAIRELRRLEEARQTLLEKAANLQRQIGKLEAELEFQEEGSHKQVNFSAIFREMRQLVHSLLEEENLAKLRAGLGQLAQMIDDILGKGGSAGRTNRELKEKKEKLTAEIEALEQRLKELKEEEQKARTSLEGFNQKFRLAYGALEAEKKKLAELLAEENRVLLAKERVVLRLADLKEELAQIGRSPDEFEKLDFGEESFTTSEEEALKKMFRLRSELASIGEVDESILRQAAEVNERYQFLHQQIADLEKAAFDLRSLIRELEQKIHSEFHGALKKINEEFAKLVRLLFGGGKGKLVVRQMVSPPNDETDKPAQGEIGVEIELTLPQKRLKGLEVLSGGERSLLSLAIIFSLISVSPPPFLVLDEIDAALDERNAKLFGEILKEFSQKTQFIVVTHNRATMEVADVLYGVTMSGDGTSKIVSLKLT
jgi:chromosome segregation protein